MDIIEFDKNKIKQFRQANALIESVYQATLTEKRILAVMISMIQPTDSDFKEYKIDIKQFAELYGIKGKSIADLVRDSTDSLRSRKITINDETKLLQVNWISSAEYPKGENYVLIKFDSKLKPYLLNLTGNYTPTLLEQVAKFKSVYAFRLYELLKQYLKIKSRKFKVDHLKQLLGCEDDYKSYANFKARVIKTALFEINNLSDLIITFLELKNGKKVSELVFGINSKSKDYKEIPDNELPKEVNFEIIKSETKEGELLGPEIFPILKNQRFASPSLEEVEQYCIEKKIHIDFERFFNFYESKDWFVGKNKMKKWHSAIANWAKEPKNYKQLPSLEKEISIEEKVQQAKREKEKDDVIAKIKYQLGQINKSSAWQLFSGCDIEQIDTGYKIIVSNQKALEYQSVLDKINIKIEVK